MPNDGANRAESNAPDRRNAGFAEIGDRCFVARYSSYDLNVGAIVGSRGIVVVDTRSSDAEAAVLLDDLRPIRQGATPIVAIVNTHWHFDHSFGNATLSGDSPDATLVCHETASETLAAEYPTLQAEAAGDDSDPRHAEIAATTVLVPTDTFSSVRTIDLGDRLVELAHPGRGHTGGDIVVSVADADVVYAGDLIEESADRSGVPGFGDDSYPLEWPATLDLVVGMVTPTSVVVPGHGAPVTRDFVQQQRADLADLAELIRSLYLQGVSADEAVTVGGSSWPFPVALLGDVVPTAYRQLAESGATPGSIPAQPSPGGGLPLL